jgi:hypothetical protein
LPKHITASPYAARVASLSPRRILVFKWARCPIQLTAEQMRIRNAKQKKPLPRLLFAERFFLEINPRRALRRFDTQ